MTSRSWASTRWTPRAWPMSRVSRARRRVIDLPEATLASERRCLSLRRLGQLEQLGHPRLHAAAHDADIGCRVVVAGDAVVQHPVVREDRDADANRARERDEGEGLDHRAAARV